MKIKIISLLLLLVIFGCKKESKEVLLTKDDLNKLFNLNNYQVNQQRKINDSVFQYKGENDRFSLEGKYNYLRNNKNGWWKLYDKKNNEKYLDIEFFTEYGSTKEVNNQIIFYKRNKIDTINSKFYKIEYSVEKQNVNYIFYCAETVGVINFAKLNIGIIADGKPVLYPTDFNCIKIKDGKYQYSLDISKYTKHTNLHLVGLFSGYSNNKSKKELGLDQIFIDDTIRIKE